MWTRSPRRPRLRGVLAGTRGHSGPRPPGIRGHVRGDQGKRQAARGGLPRLRPVRGRRQGHRRGRRQGPGREDGADGGGQGLPGRGFGRRRPAQHHLEGPSPVAGALGGRDDARPGRLDAAGQERAGHDPGAVFPGAARRRPQPQPHPPAADPPDLQPGEDRRAGRDARGSVSHAVIRRPAARERGPLRVHARRGASRSGRTRSPP